MDVPVVCICMVFVALGLITVGSRFELHPRSIPDLCGKSIRPPSNMLSIVVYRNGGIEGVVTISHKAAAGVRSWYGLQNSSLLSASETRLDRLPNDGTALNACMREPKTACMVCIHGSHY